MRKTNLQVKLINENGNAFSIMGKVIRVLKQEGYEHLVKEYQEKAMSGDYNHLLNVTQEYIEIT